MKQKYKTILSFCAIIILLMSSVGVSANTDNFSNQNKQFNSFYVGTYQHSTADGDTVVRINTNMSEINSLDTNTFAASGVATDPNNNSNVIVASSDGDLIKYNYNNQQVWNYSMGNIYAGPLHEYGDNIITAVDNADNQQEDYIRIYNGDGGLVDERSSTTISSNSNVQFIEPAGNGQIMVSLNDSLVFLDQNLNITNTIYATSNVYQATSTSNHVYYITQNPSNNFNITKADYSGSIVYTQELGGTLPESVLVHPNEQYIYTGYTGEVERLDESTGQYMSSETISGTADNMEYINGTHFIIGGTNGEEGRVTAMSYEMVEGASLPFAGLDFSRAYYPFDGPNDGGGGVTSPNRSLDLRIPKYMPLNSTVDYRVTEITNNSKYTNVTANATVTSANSSVIQINSQNYTLESTSDINNSSRITINATYDNMQDSKDITTAPVAMEYIDILPPLFKTFAVAGNIVMQYMIFVIILGITITKIVNQYGGIGAMQLALIFGWVMGWVALGVMLLSAFFAIFIILNSDVSYEIQNQA